MAFCMKMVDTYRSALFRVHQKLSVILWRDGIILCQPERGRLLPNRNVFSYKILVGHSVDSLWPLTFPCCRRYCQIDAFQEIVRAQANTKYFRQTSIPEQCRPRRLLRNWNNLNVRPQIFMRHQHLLTRSAKALDFHHGGSLPCQVKGRDHRHLVHHLRRLQSCHLRIALFH